MAMRPVGGIEMRVTVIVEGISDKIAVEALAARRGKDLQAEGVSVISVGGAHGIGRFLDRLDLDCCGVGLAGLCDAGEEAQFRHALERASLGTDLARAEMEELGFYVCEPDLEAELIRALGVAAVEDVLAAHGDIGAFRTLQKQPQWKGRPAEEQLRRFMGSGARRKIKYARLLIEALDLARVPRPLDGVLVHVERLIA
jgi:Overcoming lysogenization defect protein-like, TOPRIM domain